MCRILLADDEEDFRKVVAELLREKGHEVSECASVQEALSSVVMLKQVGGERVRAIELFGEERELERSYLAQLGILLEKARGTSNGPLVKKLAGR